MLTERRKKKTFDLDKLYDLHVNNYSSIKTALLQTIRKINKKRISIIKNQRII